MVKKCESWKKIIMEKIVTNSSFVQRLRRLAFIVPEVYRLVSSIDRE